MLLQNNEVPSTQGIRPLRQVMRDNLIKCSSKLEQIKAIVLAYLLDRCCYDNNNDNDLEGAT